MAISIQLLDLNRELLGLGRLRPCVVDSDGDLCRTLFQGLGFKLLDHRADDQAAVGDSPNAVRANQLHGAFGLGGDFHHPRWPRSRDANDFPDRDLSRCVTFHDDHAMVRHGTRNRRFQNLAFESLSATFSAQGYNADEVRSALAGTKSAIFEHSDEQLRQLAVDAVVEAIDKVFILVVVAGAVILLSGLAMPRERLFFKKTKTHAI